MFGRKKNTATATRGAGSTRGPARTVRLAQDSGGAPAVSLEKVRAAAPDLAARTEKTGIALSKAGLAGIRAEVMCLVDYSGSMSRDYADGKVQTVTERALALALQVDGDGSVPLVPFDFSARVAGMATMGTYQGIVERTIMAGPMGSTNLTAALEIVLADAKTTASPLFVIIVTDGAPDNESSANALFRELSHYPVFVKILATTEVAKDYLAFLDDQLDGVLVDNIDAQFVRDPAGLSDLAFGELMAEEWASWIDAAIAAGLLTR